MAGMSDSSTGIVEPDNILLNKTKWWYIDMLSFSIFWVVYRRMEEVVYASLSILCTFIDGFPDRVHHSFIMSLLWVYDLIIPFPMSHVLRCYLTYIFNQSHLLSNFYTKNLTIKLCHLLSRSPLCLLIHASIY